MLNKGLRKNDIVRNLHEKIDTDPDLKYYMDNEYVTRLIDLLIDGIGEVMEKNNKELIDHILPK